MPSAASPTTPAGENASKTNNNDPAPQLPPPATFDFLPPLYTLLTRLLVAPNTIHSNSPSTNTADQSIAPKDLAIMASAITAKIQKARVAVRGMEGIEMSLDEQEAIIWELEEEVERGRGVLTRLRKNCANAIGDVGSEDSSGKMDVDGEKDQEQKDDTK